MGHSGNLPAGAARTTLDCRAAGLDLKAGFQRWPTAWRSTASVRPICCSSSRTCSPTASTFRRRSGSAERSRRRRPHRGGGSAPGGARWHGPARCRPHAAPRASHERSSSGSSRGSAREVVPGTTAAARVPAAPNATPTAKPSRMLCSVMAKTSSVAVDQGVRSGGPAAAGNQAVCPRASAMAIAGSRRDQHAAASMTRAGEAEHPVEQSPPLRRPITTRPAPRAMMVSVTSPARSDRRRQSSEPGRVARRVHEYPAITDAPAGLARRTRTNGTAPARAPAGRSR
jgi:hypothetical protein